MQIAWSAKLQAERPLTRYALLRMDRSPKSFALPRLATR
jgi:hypothetical protein